jgi:hypothetical protein
MSNSNSEPGSQILTVRVFIIDDDERPPKIPRTENRGKNNKNRSRRRKFDHDGALSNINRDYLGPDPLFGSEFAAQFWISGPQLMSLQTPSDTL